MTQPAAAKAASNRPLPQQVPPPAGQGASRQVYGLLGISGSQTGGQGVIDISIPDSSVQRHARLRWPLNIPQSGKQTEYKLNVPYRCFAATAGDNRAYRRALHSQRVTPRH